MQAKYKKLIIIFAIIGTLFFVFRSEQPPVQFARSLPSIPVDNLSKASQTKSRGLAAKKSVQSSTTSFQIKTRALLKLDKVNQIIAKKLELEAMLRANPRFANNIPSYLLKQTGSKRSKLAMINSLAEVESRESKRALFTILKSEAFNQDFRLQALVSSTELTAPDNRIINELWKLSAYRPDDSAPESYFLDGAALLGLGSIASRTNSAQSNKIVDALIGKLNVAEINGDKKAIDYLDALGNSGNPKVIEIADRYILSPSVSERALGASILRKVKDKKADKMLLELIDLDEAPEVRRAAVQSLSLRKIDDRDFQHLGELVLEEPDSGIRFEMINYLKSHININSSAKNYLEKLLTLEDNESNYNQIVQAIGQT